MADETQRAIRKVLVATDFSEPSRLAVAQAVSIAATQRATLVLLHVDTGHEADATAALAEVAIIEGIEVERRVEKGHPDEVICQVARDTDVDLIVTGTHGRTGLQRFLLGSVAEKVVRMAERDVLVARPTAAASALFEHVLVPTDFSEAAERALHMALILAAPGATVELFHAWQYPPGAVVHGLPDDERNPMAALQREIEHAGASHGAEWVQRHAQSDLTLKFTQAYGPAAATVHERLEKGGYDLVAMGTHGRRGFRRFLLGSVAEATVRHSPRPVLVVHAG